MKATLYIRTIETDDNGEYDYGGRMTNEDWSDLMCQQAVENNRYVDPWAAQYMYEMRHGHNPYDDMVNDYQEELDVLDCDYDDGHMGEVACHCEVLDDEENEITEEFFEMHEMDEDVFLLCLSVRPTDEDMDKTMENRNSMSDGDDYCRPIKVVKEIKVPWNDAESELRFWLDDSAGIIDDEEYDTEMKIKILPSRPLTFDIGGNFYMIPDSRVLEIRSDEDEPYKFVILGSKITRLR